MAHVCIFGDSITFGAWDLQGGWVQRIRTLVDQRNTSEDEYSCFIYNLGVSGDTAAGILDRFDSELPFRTGDEPEDETIVLFAVGINDSAYEIAGGRSQFLIEEYRENLSSLVEKAKKYSSKICLVGLNPVDQIKVDPIPWHPELAYRNDIIKAFNDQIENLCQKEDLYFVDIWKDWQSRDVSELVSDGIHPNGKGHKLIAEQVKGFFEASGLL